jgi:hypothetical protein
MSYVFDKEKAWDNLVARVRADERHQQWTLYGVACVNHDLSSHGVTVAPDAAAAFEAAVAANRGTPDGGCTYYPVGISVMPAVVIAIMEQLANEPPEGRAGA